MTQDSNQATTLSAWWEQLSFDHKSLFTLNEQGAIDRLLIPEKLYGREREVQTLIDAFAHVVQSQAPPAGLPLMRLELSTRSGG